jgi:hypothetical protein
MCSKQKPSGALLKAYFMLVPGAGIVFRLWRDVACSSTGCLFAAEGF